VQQVEETLGPVTLLVNNAGISGAIGPMWENDPESWRRTFDVNIHGPYYCASAVLKRMVPRRQGRIVNVGSTAGNFSAPYIHQYCVTKAALQRFTECIAAEAGEYGIVAFNLDPGTVRTPFNERILALEEAHRYIPWFFDIFEQGRDVPAELSANFLVRLASGEADALSGRFVRAYDDLDQILRQMEAVQANDLYALRMAHLPA
jgi:NAD(P)-dependent dehydrogenase (short-subunit alcohol dehydrogenase family)